MICEEEVIEALASRVLNPKTNNYIFQVDNLDVIEKIGKTSIIYPCDAIYDDIYMKKKTSKNIFIDFDKISVFEMLSYILKELDKEESIPFYDKLDVVKFNSKLKRLEEYIQIICYNVENLSEAEAQLLNELYYFNSNKYSIITFTQDVYPTYFLTGNRELDSRENFTQFKVRKSYQKEK